MARRSWCLVIAVLAVAIFAAVPVTAQETVVYSEGFETTNGGFTLLGANTANWQWGTPPATPGPGACHTGTKCWGTNFGARMPRPADASIVSPVLALPPVSGNQVIRVRFWAFVSLDGMYDRGEFFISKDRTTWQSLMQMYNNMATSPTLAPAWQKYEFTIDPAYANGPIYLRFRAATPYSTSTFYCGGSDDLSGVYIDDLKISVYDFAGPRKMLQLEAWEDPSSWASCPWLAPWNGTAFTADNDVYSVARGVENEYTDYYKLGTRLAARDGVYPIEIQERDNEKSYTDYVALIQVDHAPDVAVAPDGAGTLHGYRPSALISPISATVGGQTVLAQILSASASTARGSARPTSGLLTGTLQKAVARNSTVATPSAVVPPPEAPTEPSSALTLLSTADDQGVAAYSGDTVTVNFGNVNAGSGAILVLRVAGFLVGVGADPQPYTGPPAIVVETKDGNGNWVERGRLRPRFNFSVGAFDLAPFLAAGQPVTVRLRSISHDVKYNSIDWVALYNGAQPAFTSTTTEPTVARFGAQDVLGNVSVADSNYFETSPGETFYLEFPERPLAEGAVREFVFVAKGYYTPLSGTYLIYTQEGGEWVLRDAFTFPGSDATKSFDLSLFLPDASGEFKARIWQDYQYEPAGIDFVGMTVGASAAPLNYAYDFRKSTSVLSQLQTSNNVRDEAWGQCPRNRVLEVRFTPPGPINLPPTTNPVTATSAATPTISWTYADGDGDAQAQAEVQVWTAPGGNGTILWNPPAIPGAGTSALYAGSALTPGVTCYARVRAYDGKDWGPWSEGTITASAVVLCGDLNADGVVNLVDYNIMRAAFGSQSGQGRYNVITDLDKDGVVSLKDYSAWYACYVKYR